jgi:uncharacterized membrane protein
VFDGSGWWVIFPIIGLVFMLLMMSRMLGFWSRGPGRGTGPRRMRMGPMGMMGDQREQDSEPDESALEVLRRRYAAGELTDEEFDAKRRRLEGR